MNFRIIAHYVRNVLQLLSAFLVIPLLFSLVRREYAAVRGLLITALISTFCFLLLRLIKNSQKSVSVRDSFVSVAVCWIVFSILGALPYWISGEISSPLNALFESVSGFTTTGFSVVDNVEAMSKGLLLWRSFTQWIGGMGVLVFLLALVPTASGDRQFTVLRAESPGPAPGKLVPRLRQNSMILYLIYLALTVAQFLFLIFGGLPLFDSVVTALSTAGTGGFSVMNASIAGYGSLYVEIVCTVFMVLFAVNFNVYYFILMRNGAAIRRNEELRTYLGIVAASILLITISLVGNAFATVSESLRHASFQVASVISTSGFSTTSMTNWPMFSRMILLLLAVLGGSAGSTAGGLKVSRLIILVREAKSALFRVARPRSVEHVRMEGKTVDRETAQAVSTYFCMLMLLTFGSVLLVALENLDFGSTFGMVVSCIGNVGSDLGMVDPGVSYATISPLSRIVLCINMLLGRLELYPLLLLCSPRTWRRV